VCQKSGDRVEQTPAQERERRERREERRRKKEKAI
jgi:hypothetical protein